MELLSIDDAQHGLLTKISNCLPELHDPETNAQLRHLLSEHPSELAELGRSGDGNVLGQALFNYCLKNRDEDDLRNFDYAIGLLCPFFLIEKLATNSGIFENETEQCTLESSIEFHEAMLAVRCLAIASRFRAIEIEGRQEALAEIMRFSRVTLIDSPSKSGISWQGELLGYAITTVSMSRYGMPDDDPDRFKDVLSWLPIAQSQGLLREFVELLHSCSVQCFSTLLEEKIAAALDEDDDDAKEFLCVLNGDALDELARLASSAEPQRGRINALAKKALQNGEVLLASVIEISTWGKYRSRFGRMRRGNPESRWRLLSLLRMSAPEYEPFMSWMFIADWGDYWEDVVFSPFFEIAVSNNSGMQSLLCEALVASMVGKHAHHAKKNHLVNSLILGLVKNAADQQTTAASMQLYFSTGRSFSYDHVRKMISRFEADELSSEVQLALELFKKCEAPS